MVTTHTPSAICGEDIDFNSALEHLAGQFGAGDAALIRNAGELVLTQPDTLTVFGAAHSSHAIGSATQVADLHLDADSVAAALLIGLTDHWQDDALSAQLNPQVIKLARGVARMDEIGQLVGGGESARRDDKARQKVCARCCWRWWKTFV